MYTWLKPLYVGEVARDSQRRIVRRIRRHKGLIDIYAIIVPPSGINQLEYINANYLMQPMYMNTDITIVGIAKGFAEAQQIVMEIADDAIRELGTPDIRRYLRAKLENRGRG